jgi:peptidoglycan/LPS O-acetylase OafA/YrhL
MGRSGPVLRYLGILNYRDLTGFQRVTSIFPEFLYSPRAADLASVLRRTFPGAGGLSILQPTGSMVHQTARWFFYVFYIQNFVLYGSRLLGVTWSLAVEEQFYTTWPFVVSWLGRKNFQRLVVALLLAAPFIRLIARPYAGPAFALLTFWRMDGILAGSLLALWFRSESITLPRLRKVGTLLLVIGGIGSIRLLLTRGQESVWLFSFLAVTFSGVLCFAAVDSILPAPLRSLLNNSWLRYLGRISYGMYLLHPLVYQGFYFLTYKMSFHLRDTFWEDVFSLLLEVGLVVAAASVSWYFFEKPIARLKEKFVMTGPNAMPSGQSNASSLLVLSSLPTSTQAIKADQV